MYNVSFRYRDETEIGCGIMQWLPRIGEKVILNSVPLVIYDIVYMLKNGTTNTIDVRVYVHL